MDEQDPFAVDQGGAVPHGPDTPPEGLDVRDVLRHGGGESSRRVRAQGSLPRGQTHSAVRSSSVAALGGKGRTMASTVNEAMRLPGSSCTRHSEWVIPSPAKVERWWYSIQRSARTSPCNDRAIPLMAVERLRCACSCPTPS